MFRLTAVVAITVGALGVSSCTSAPADPLARVRRAADVMGATALASLRYEATGSHFALGQSPRPDAPWPRFDVPSLTVEIDYASSAMSLDLTRTGVEPPRGGGGQPLAGPERRVEFVSGAFAWALHGDHPVPEPAVAAERAVQIWMSPHGFLKGALAHDTTVEEHDDGRATVRYTVLGTHVLTGTIDAADHVERVDTTIASPVLGDMPVVSVYDGYETFAGVRMPTRIRQAMGGFPVWDLAVTGVTPQAAVSIVAPPDVASAAPPVPLVELDEVEEGVHYVTGGSHHSVVIEFGDHMAIVEAPLDEARAEAVIAAVRAAIPGKAIRYVINTHPHFDHAGGLRTFVAEGAIVVTHEINRPFYERAWAAPRTLAPDRLSETPRAPEFITVDDWHEFTDRRRLIEVHHLAGNAHHDGLLMVWMPRERILIQADAYTPGPAALAPPARANPFSVNLFEHIHRLAWPVDVILPLHGHAATYDDLVRAVGR
ncbi:MAG: MBL fold metallo-hydrolase [Vicinamibacterales bacterium]|nr:MBL fold metallo-hydrolase [Vicinamibacterales bacterium]